VRKKNDNEKKWRIQTIVLWLLLSIFCCCTIRFSFNTYSDAYENSIEITMLCIFNSKQISGTTLDANKK
jgi:hypothetical protein